MKCELSVHSAVALLASSIFPPASVAVNVAHASALGMTQSPHHPVPLPHAHLMMTRTRQCHSIMSSTDTLVKPRVDGASQHVQLHGLVRRSLELAGEAVMASEKLGRESCMHWITLYTVRRITEKAFGIWHFHLSKKKVIVSKAKNLSNGMHFIYIQPSLGMLKK